MSTTAAQPATTPIPVQLSEPEFTAFILPHLSMPKRGPKCKLGYYRVFNLILWVLYTGMQWKSLPVPHDPEGKPANWDDIAHVVEQILTEDQTIRYYRHVVIDEGQDFTPAMLRSLALAIPSDGSLTFFGDMAQQIYGNRISWRMAGRSIYSSL